MRSASCDASVLDRNLNLSRKHRINGTPAVIFEDGSRAPGAIPAIGGAMDLAIGAKSVYVMTDLLTKQGESKLVDACSYPLTGVGCVSRVYTDHAIFDVTPDGFAVTEAFGTNTVASLAELTGLVLSDATGGSAAATAAASTPAKEN